MKRNFVLSAIIFLTALSFTFAQKKTTIKGYVSNYTGITTVYLDNILSESEVTNSEINSKGEFILEPAIENANFFKLRFDEKRVVFLIIEPGEKIEIKVSLDNIQAPEIKGSKGSKLFYSLIKKSSELEDKIEEFNKKIQDERKTLIKKMIKANPNSLACLFFINDLDQVAEIEYYKILAEGLKKYSNNK